MIPPQSPRPLGLAKDWEKSLEGFTRFNVTLTVSPMGENCPCCDHVLLSLEGMLAVILLVEGCLLWLSVVSWDLDEGVVGELGSEQVDDRADFFLQIFSQSLFDVCEDLFDGAQGTIFLGGSDVCPGTGMSAGWGGMSWEMFISSAGSFQSWSK